MIHTAIIHTYTHSCLNSLENVVVGGGGGGGDLKRSKLIVMTCHDDKSLNSLIHQNVVCSLY